MKKTWIAILTLALAGTGSSLAQTDTVTSVNAVGMVRVPLEPGKFSFVAFPFINEGSDEIFVEELLGQLPVGTVINIWNSSTQTYQSVQKLTDTFWNPPNTVLERGVGFFVLLPNNSQPTDLVLSGEVPGATSFGTTDVEISAGFTPYGFPYPVEMTIEETDLASDLPVGSRIAVWRDDLQSYLFVQKLTDTFWNPPSQVINPGKAVFVESSVSISSTQSIPYSWPSN